VNPEGPSGGKGSGVISRRVAVVTWIDQTRATYNTVAASYAARLPEVVEPPLDQLLLELFARQAQGVVLDAGCGTGRVTAHLANLGVEVEGVDLSPGMIEQARTSYPHLRFRTGDLTDLDHPDHAYGAVLSWYSIVHTPPDELPAIWTELRRVLQPGGTLLVGFKVGDTCRHLSSAYGLDVSLDVYWLPMDHVCEGLTAAGFDITARIERAPVDIEKQPQGFVLAC
jgi:SAM-dependent methyltransferase